MQSSEINIFIGAYQQLTMLILLRIRDIFVLRSCVIGFALRNLRDIYFFANGAGGVQYFCCLTFYQNLTMLLLQSKVSD